MPGSFVRRWGQVVCGPDGSPANVCAGRAKELGDYKTGVIRACRGTRPGDALRPNRQPQKPRPKPSHSAMCLGSCSRSPDGWPGWPIAACARHARFRLNDRPSAGLHGGPSASCGYAPVIKAPGLTCKGRPADQPPLSPESAWAPPTSLSASASASASAPALGLGLGMDASRSTSLACRPPCALHFVSIWLLHLARRPAKLPGVGPDHSQCVSWAPSRPTTVPQESSARCIDIARELLPMQSGDSAVARLAHPTDTRSGRRRHYSQGPRYSQRKAAAGRMAAQWRRSCALEQVALRAVLPTPPVSGQIPPVVCHHRPPPGMPHRLAG